MEWRRGPVIGRGSSAAVSLATTAAGEVFAVKSAEIASSASLRSEQQLISQLSSPFIVKCLGYDITRERDASVYNILLEYVSGGTLSDLIRDNGGSLDEGTIRFYAKQILDGLSYLHGVGIVHCDVKGHNMLIGEDGCLKIADFGCAKRPDSGGGGFAGTAAYMAPEVARGEEQGFAADVWALGCTVVEMATGANPWPEMRDPAAALYRVAYSGDAPEIPAWFSGEARDFVERCFEREARERWTAAELLRHPFLAEEGSAGVRKSARKSPTSVMDRRFWDALEASDSPTENPSSSDSPAGRIRGLIGDCGFPANLDFPAAEEDWVTVRGEVEVEIEGVNWDYQNLINEDEDSLFHSDWDEISSNIDIIISEFENIVGDCDIDDSIAISVAFERMVMKLLLIQINFSQLCFSSFPLSPSALFFAAPFSKHGTVYIWSLFFV